MSDRASGRRHEGSVGWGFLLIGMGVLFLLHNTGWIGGNVFARLWPAYPAIFGIATLVGARRAGQVGGGVVLVAISAYLFVSNEGLYGFDWSNSWPLAIVAAGLGQLATAIASRFLPEGGSCGKEARRA